MDEYTRLYQLYVHKSNSELQEIINPQNGYTEAAMKAATAILQERGPEYQEEAKEEAENIVPPSITAHSKKLKTPTWFPIGAILLSFIIGAILITIAFNMSHSSHFEDNYTAKIKEVEALRSKLENMQAQYNAKAKELEAAQKTIADLQQSLNAAQTQQNPTEPISASQPSTSATQPSTAQAPATVPAHRTGENIIGVSDKDVFDIGGPVTFKGDNVRNDITGNWRISTIAENINIADYALSYYKKLFSGKSEVHIIVNFKYYTTTSITYSGGLLFVDTYDYVKGEEHDAKTLCSGTHLSKVIIYTDNGDIEKVSE